MHRPRPGHRPRTAAVRRADLGLDPIATGAIEELVHELKKRVTILIVTHNMQQAARVSDYTAYMYLGEMIEFGKTDEDLHQAERQAHRRLHHRPHGLGEHDMNESQHLSSQFDEDLGRLRTHVLQMGGMVETQVRRPSRPTARAKWPASNPSSKPTARSTI